MDDEEIRKLSEGLKRSLSDSGWHPVNLDFEAQLLAIKDLLRRNRQADEDLEQRIKDLYEQAQQTTEVWRNSPYQDDRFVDETYQSFFQDAAHSMAAVGMLVPFLEAFFVASFQCVRDEVGRTKQATSEDQRTQAWESKFLDLHSQFKKRRGKRQREGFVAAIDQLARSIGLAPFFPNDYRKTLEALFQYRNKMFHLGFEWPEGECKKFQNRVEKGDWPSNWFLKHVRTEEPWIFCMSKEFIEHCLWTTDQVLDGFRTYFLEKVRS